jgi:tetratricopeptide (TPR) repeat protein
VTVPAIVLLCVAAAVPASGRIVRPAYAWPPSWAPVVLATATIALAAIAASAILPAWSQSEASHSLSVAGAAKSPADLRRAATDALVAARLNPLATAPLLDAATIAQRRGLFGAARSYLLQAARRAPYDAVPWTELAELSQALGDYRGAYQAAAKATALDPLNPFPVGVARGAAALVALPQNSLTAIGTPLSP